MSKLMIIGAGGVARVAIFKCAIEGNFEEILVASRTKEKCDRIVSEIGEKSRTKLVTAELDAMDIDATAKMISET